MRLLKTKLMSETGALEIEDFDDIGIPKYAILSHRWGNDEPTLQDVERGTTAKKGFKKVQQSCDRAKRDGIDYIWIDTCCIDKTSSSELSEAINSMYIWYFQAHRCYAYLADVPSKPFRGSDWFTRGWTLQELLAPADLVFLDADWKVLGTKEDLQKEIFSCTGIPVGILSGDEDLETCSIAQRMSWAAKRSTKRVEDLAYCLLGIFGINMPLLYGEGVRAFTRLQEEIMRVSDDHSLFAWESPDSRGGLLATSPAAFKGSGSVVQLSHVDDSHNTLTISSRGVHLDFLLIGKGAEKLGLGLLQCKERDGSNNQIAIYLKDVTGTMETFRRVRSNELERLDLAKTRSSQYVTKRGCIQTGRIIPTRSKVNGIEIYESHDEDLWDMYIDFAQPEALWHAAQEGRQDDVWVMLTRRDIDINSMGRDAGPALFHAADNDHEAIVTMLLARGADINLSNARGYTPLMVAIEKGHEAIVKLLLERGADITVDVEKAHNQREIIFKSFKKDNFTHVVMEDIYANLSHYQVPVLVWAAVHQQENIIKLLLDKITEVDFKKTYGPILLKWAIRVGHKNFAGWLLDRGVEINSKRFSDGGLAPASIVSLYGNEDFLKLLYEKGVSIDAKDYNGRTPLSLAAEYGYDNTIKLLFKKGASIEAKDNDGRTPLSWAATSYKNKDTIKLLLEKGANIETNDSNGRTPLSWAVEHSSEDIIKLLLENGADIEANDSNGQTPLLWAVEHSSEDIIKLLLENGANIEANDSNGRTPLLWAFEHGIHDIIKLLLENGADIEANDSNGRTPLLWASTRSSWWREEFIKLLLENGARVKRKEEIITRLTL